MRSIQLTEEGRGLFGGERLVSRVARWVPFSLLSDALTSCMVEHRPCTKCTGIMYPFPVYRRGFTTSAQRTSAPCMACASSWILREEWNGATLES